MAESGGTELAKAYVQIVPSAKGIKGAIGEILGDEADEAGKKGGSIFSSSFGNAIKSIGSIVASATASMATGVENLAEYGDNIDKMSQKMGLSAQAYQEWDAIMQHSGTSIDALQAGMKTLANAVENGNAAFGRLGITEERIAGLNNEELFSAAISALQNVENETERTYLAGQLLGRGATELGALLNTSAEDTEAMRQRVHELGGVMSDSAVKAAAAFQDSLQDMQTSISGLSRSLLSDFLPSVTMMMDGLTEVFSGDGETGVGMIGEGVSKALHGITEKLPEFFQTGSEIIQTIAAAIIENLPEISRMGLETLIALVRGIADNLETLIPAVVATVLEIVDILTEPETLEELVKAGVYLISAIAEGVINALPDLLEKAPEIILSLTQALIDAIPILAETSLKLWGRIGDVFAELTSSAGDWGKDLIDNFIDGIKERFQHLIDVIKDVAQTVKDYLGFSEPKKGPLSDFHTFAPDMIDLLTDGIRKNIGRVESTARVLAGAVSDSFGDVLSYDAGLVPALSASDRRMQALQFAARDPADVFGNLSGYNGTGDIMLDITSEIDGAVLARNQVAYSADEAQRRGKRATR